MWMTQCLSNDLALLLPSPRFPTLRKGFIHLWETWGQWFIRLMAPKVQVRLIHFSREVDNCCLIHLAFSPSSQNRTSPSLVRYFFTYSTHVVTELVSLFLDASVPLATISLSSSGYPNQIEQIGHSNSKWGRRKFLIFSDLAGEQETEKSAICHVEGAGVQWQTVKPSE